MPYRYRLIKKFFLLALILIHPFLFSQENKITASHKTELQQATHDTVRVRILNELIEIVPEEEILFYSEKLKNLTQKNIENSTLTDKVKRFYLKYHALSLNTIGYINYQQGNIIKALEYYQKSLKIQEHLEEKYDMSMTLNGLGVIYSSQKQYRTALIYYNKSLKICEELSDKEGMALSTQNIAAIYSDDEKNAQPEQAIKYYNYSLKLLEEIGNERGIAVCLTNIGTNYCEKKDYNEALKYYTRSLKIREKIQDKKGIASSLIKVGMIYNKLGNKYKAFDNVHKGMLLAQHQGFSECVRDAAEILTLIYRKQNKYKEALEAYELFIQTRDRLTNQETREESVKKQLQYEYEKKETLLKEQQVKKELLSETMLAKKNFIITLMTGILITSILGSLIIILFYRQNKLKTSQKTLLLEQKLLRLQMNPHFIFNALTAIQGFINTGKKNEASIYLAKISKLIRTILENSREEYILFEKEINYLENYLSVNQLLMDNKFDYKIEVDENIDIEQMSIPPMMAQPFIENALKHGIQGKQGKGFIVVRFKKINDAVLFEVEDNGIGLVQSESQSLQEHRSLATLITKERLANLYSVSVNEIQIHIQEIKNTIGLVSGTKTIFEIPIKPY